MSQHRRSSSLGALPAFQSARASGQPQPLGVSLAEDKLGGEYAEEALVRHDQEPVQQPKAATVTAPARCKLTTASRR